MIIDRHNEATEDKKYYQTLTRATCLAPGWDGPSEEHRGLNFDDVLDDNLAIDNETSLAMRTKRRACR